MYEDIAIATFLLVSVCMCVCVCVVHHFWVWLLGVARAWSLLLMGRVTCIAKWLFFAGVGIIVGVVAFSLCPADTLVIS